jgi:hypothetical protein
VKIYSWGVVRAEDRKVWNWSRKTGKGWVWGIRRTVNIEDSQFKWGEGESDRWEFEGREGNFVRGGERWEDTRRFSDKKGSAAAKVRVGRAGDAGARRNAK